MDAPGSVLAVLRRELPVLRRKHGVRSLALFGSAARGEARAESDVDVLVDFEGPATFQRYMGVKFHLEDLLEKRVDLVTRKGLRPELAAGIEREAVHVA